MYDLLILGGGQLGRMSAQAGQKLGVRCLVLDPDPDCPASVAADVHVGEIEDPHAIAEAAKQADAITLENEFIPADIVQQALSAIGKDSIPITPNLEALATIQDKLRQRQAYANAQVPTPRAVELTSIDEAEAEIGFPMVIKARFRGYDGKGTRTAKTRDDLLQYQDLFMSSLWLAESFVPFKRELAVMVWRTPYGSGAFPTMETIQTNHVCDLVFPAGIDASKAALEAVKAVNGYGLFGVELFEHQDGTLSINEIAPRPHNTGHYTLDSGGVSQFEQHIRLALGLTPATPSAEPAAMANILGQSSSIDGWAKARDAVLADFPDIHFHWYDKRESRPGRKLGHINAVGEGAKELAKLARDHFYSSWASIQGSAQS